MSLIGSPPHPLARLTFVGAGPFPGGSPGCQINVDLAARHPDVIQRAILQGPTAPPAERTWFWQSVRWRQNQPFNAIPERHPVPDALPLAEAEETIAAITAGSTRPGPSDDRDHWSAVG